MSRIEAHIETIWIANTTGIQVFMRPPVLSYYGGVIACLVPVVNRTVWTVAPNKLDLRRHLVWKLHWLLLHSSTVALSTPGQSIEQIAGKSAPLQSKAGLPVTVETRMTASSINNVHLTDI